MPITNCKETSTVLNDYLVEIGKMPRATMHPLYQLDILKRIENDFNSAKQISIGFDDGSIILQEKDRSRVSLLFKELMDEERNRISNTKE